MIKREEVEAILAETNAYTGRHAGIVAELCRTWLRVNDAPVGLVWEIDTYGGEGDYVTVDTTVPTGLTVMKTVRLVPEADSGGDRG